MGISKEELNAIFKECQPSSTLSKLHSIADDLIEYVYIIFIQIHKYDEFYLDISNDHMIFEKYLVFLLKMVDYLNSFFFVIIVSFRYSR